MKLIADSGSTKTDWAILDRSGIISEFRTSGLNPHYVSYQFVISELQDIEELKNKEISEIHFYGAGCGNEKNKELIKKGLEIFYRLNQHVKTPSIYVETDMLGAARGLSNESRSFITILGTGSNCCEFDGEKIIFQFPSLGFILGDEGSGAFIGKIFLKKYLENELPEELHDLFYNKIRHEPFGIIEKIYRFPFPNMYAASFMPFIKENIKHEFCRDLVKQSFLDFFNHTLCKVDHHQKIPLQVTGSVGFYFQDLLREAAAEKNIIIEKIKASPMEGLAQYHLKKH